MAQLRGDPTRTTMIRKAFMADARRRFRAVNKEVINLIVTLDAFGLKDPTPGLPTLNVEPREYQFQTDPQKITTFNTWLGQQVDDKILTTTGTGEPWTQTYINSAYRKGAVKAYTDARKLQGRLGTTAEFFEGSKEEFLRSSFAGPVATNKVRLLATRSFNEMKGATEAMKQQLNRTLANGIVQGHGPSVIARQMTKQIKTITRTRAEVIARTEVVHAHAEGALDSFERLGIDELGIQAEFATASDDRVCARCQALEGRTFTVDEARGIIPIHPNCRCAWIPSEQVDVGEQAVKPESTEVVGEVQDPFLQLPLNIRSVKGTNNWVKENLPEQQTLLDNLSKAQRGAIKTYKIASGVNKVLRGGAVHTPTSLALVESLDQTISQSGRNLKVFRGARSRGSWLDELSVGSEFVDKGFPSTTLLETKTHDFLSSEGSRVLMEINLKKGDRALYLDAVHTRHAKEAEVLLGRGLKFRVVGEEEVEVASKTGKISKVRKLILEVVDA